MRIAILHQDLEKPEKEFKKIFENKGIQTDLFDIRNTKPETLYSYDCVMNRVYASVANRDYKDNLQTLKLLTSLEANGVICINSSHTTKVDYSKAYSASVMKAYGVLTPETLKINSIDEKEKAIQFAKRFGYPLIIKRDMGGRSKDIFKIDSSKQLKDTINYFFTPEVLNEYNAGIVVQQFVKTTKPHDCRIAIVNGEFAYAFARTLISEDNSDGWLASIARGSKAHEYSPDEKTIELAKNATEAIGALWNEVDITFTEQGPVIIENNPTPNFVSYAEERMNKAADLAIQETTFQKYGTSETKMEVIQNEK